MSLSEWALAALCFAAAVALFPVMLLAYWRRYPERSQKSMIRRQDPMHNLLGQWWVVNGHGDFEKYHRWYPRHAMLRIWQRLRDWRQEELDQSRREMSRRM